MTVYCIIDSISHLAIMETLCIYLNLDHYIMSL